MASALYYNTADVGVVAATPIYPTAGPNEDIIIKKIIVGKPTAAKSITIFNMANALINNTTNIAFKYTYPTFAAGTPASDVIDLTTQSTESRSGMEVPEGGSITTDAAMQVTVLFDEPES